MSDALQHAAIAALIAFTALLEVRRRRELERAEAERAERLRQAAVKGTDNPT